MTHPRFQNRVLGVQLHGEQRAGGDAQLADQLADQLALQLYGEERAGGESQLDAQLAPRAFRPRSSPCS